MSDTHMTDPRVSPTTGRDELPSDYGDRAKLEEGDKPAWPVGGWQSVTHRIFVGPERIPRTSVVVEFVVNAKGKVIEAEVIEGGNPKLNQAIVDAFLTTCFEPGLKGGKPVGMRMRQALNIEVEAK